MSKKRKKRVTTGGKLDVDARVGDFQGPELTGIGAIVDGPCIGDQKIRMQIRTATVDNKGLLIGAVVRSCTDDES